MAGLICHAAEMNKKFAFVWEGNTSSNASYSSVDKVPTDWYGYPKSFSASSHTDDTWRAETFDRCDFRGWSLVANNLYLIMSDYDDTDADWLKNSKWIHKVVARGIDATGLTPGMPADLKLMVHNGTIHCFYRPTPMDGQAPAQWRYAFSYKAGRFGIVGRGHAGIQWDSFYYAYAQANPFPTGRDKIPLYDNYVDFWNIKLSDGVMDRPMEEVLKRRCWQGFTPTKFNVLVNDPGIFVPSGGVKAYDQVVENLTIDFKISISAGSEAGVICRAVDAFNIVSK